VPADLTTIRSQHATAGQHTRSTQRQRSATTVRRPIVSQLRRHLQHPLTRGQQLLGQLMTDPAGAFHRPGPLRPRLGPPQQPLGLDRRGAHPQLAQRLLRGVDGHRRVRGLVRIHPDHYHRHDWHLLPLPGGQDRGGHAQFQESQRCSRPSFDPRHGEAPARWHVVRKPSPAGAGSGYENQACRDLSTLRARLTAIPARPATPANNWGLSRGTPSKVRHCRGRTRYPFTRLSKLIVPGTSPRKPASCQWICQ
jgi:hypothetical protein